LILLLALLLSNAEADSRTGQIVIRGTVEPVCALEVVDYGTRLDLVDGEKGAAIGAIRETCNRPEGYTLSFSSRSGGRLMGGFDRDVAYRISYDGLLDEALGSDRQLGRAGPEWNREHELLVDLSGRPDLPAGEYSDVIIIEIVAR
jgi:hypothetical protein